MTMEVALEALVTLKIMVQRWGAIRLGFVVGSRGLEVGEGKVEFITDEEVRIQENQVGSANETRL